MTDSTPVRRWTPVRNGTAFMGMRSVGYDAVWDDANAYVREDDFDRLQAENVRLKGDLFKSIGQVLEMLKQRADFQRLATEACDQRDSLRAQIAARDERIKRLEEALRGLYEDQVDYLTLNNLGGMDNHWMKAARAALAKGEANE